MPNFGDTKVQDGFLFRWEPQWTGSTMGSWEYVGFAPTPGSTVTKPAVTEVSPFSPETQAFFSAVPKEGDRKNMDGNVMLYHAGTGPGSYAYWENIGPANSPGSTVTTFEQPATVAPAQTAAPASVQTAAPEPTPTQQMTQQKMTQQNPWGGEPGTQPNTNTQPLVSQLQDIINVLNNPGPGSTAPGGQVASGLASLTPDIAAQAYQKYIDSLTTALADSKQKDAEREATQKALAHSLSQSRLSALSQQLGEERATEEQRMREALAARGLLDSGSLPAGMANIDTGINRLLAQGSLAASGDEYQQLMDIQRSATERDFAMKQALRGSLGSAMANQLGYGLDAAKLGLAGKQFDTSTAMSLLGQQQARDQFYADLGLRRDSLDEKSREFYDSLAEQKWEAGEGLSFNRWKTQAGIDAQPSGWDTLLEGVGSGVGYAAPYWLSSLFSGGGGAATGAAAGGGGGLLSGLGSILALLL